MSKVFLYLLLAGFVVLLISVILWGFCHLLTRSREGPTDSEVIVIWLCAINKYSNAIVSQFTNKKIVWLEGCIQDKPEVPSPVNGKLYFLDYIDLGYYAGRYSGTETSRRSYRKGKVVPFSLIMEDGTKILINIDAELKAGPHETSYKEQPKWKTRSGGQLFINLKRKGAIKLKSLSKEAIMNLHENFPHAFKDLASINRTTKTNPFNLVEIILKEGSSCTVLGELREEKNGKWSLITGSQGILLSDVKLNRLSWDIRIRFLKSILEEYVFATIISIIVILNILYWLIKIFL